MPGSIPPSGNRAPSKGRTKVSTNNQKLLSQLDRCTHDDLTKINILNCLRAGISKQEVEIRLHKTYSGSTPFHRVQISKQNQEWKIENRIVCSSAFREILKKMSSAKQCQYLKSQNPEYIDKIFNQSTPEEQKTFNTLLQSLGLIFFDNPMGGKKIVDNNFHARKYASPSPTPSDEGIDPR